MSMASLGTVGGCLRAIAEATADDIMLSRFLSGTDLSVGHVRNPLGWEDARPPRPVLVQMASQVLEYCRKQRNGSHGPPEVHDDPDSPFEFVLGSEINGAPYELHDMLVEGVLTASGISVVYGASNSGKTFLMLDMACAIARGVDWLGRYRVQQGAVLYLASEGPRSVKFRLQAYQHFYGQSVQLLAVVEEPINLFASDIDARGIISTIDAIERATGEPVRLVVGDTLSALTPGANENHGTDMGIVLGNINRIVCARPVHFSLIHHCGKDEARGMRGWSGLNARTDTAIEVVDSTDATTSHSAEIVKQRDVAGRREKITFDLRSVELNAWDNFNNSLTSCVVESTDKPAPERRNSGSVHRAPGRPKFAEGLITGFISGQANGVSRADLVKHFQGKPSRTTIYRVIDDLLAAQKIVESLGVLRVLGDGA